MAPSLTIDLFAFCRSVRAFINAEDRARGKLGAILTWETRTLIRTFENPDVNAPADVVRLLQRMSSSQDRVKCWATLHEFIHAANAVLEGCHATPQIGRHPDDRDDMNDREPVDFLS